VLVATLIGAMVVATDDVLPQQLAGPAARVSLDAMGMSSAGRAAR
jgi:hypothetical protein